MVNFANTSWLSGKLLGSESVTVTIRRDGFDDVLVSAMAGATRRSQEIGDSGSMQIETRDWFIATSAYAFGGSATEPAPGDLIIETVGYVERTYELRPEAGGACARPSDRSRAMWRCSTKLIAKAVSATAGTASTGLTQRGSAWQADQLEVGSSITITLRRSGFDDVTLTAVHGSTVVEQILDDGSSMQLAADDFIIKTDDYRIDDELTEPADGDILITDIDGTLRRYELRPFAGEPCARPLDQSRVQWRCHAKFIGTGDVDAVELTENQLRCIIGIMPRIGSDGWDENELRHMAGIASLAN